MPKSINFIGRKAEIDLIGHLLLEFGTSRFLCIKGEGGIGKTRLLDEFRERVKKGYFEPNKLYASHRIVFAHEFTDSVWSQQLIQGAEGMARELNVVLDSTDAQFDPQRMAEQLAAHIASKPSAIIVSLGSRTLVEKQLQCALRQNIPVITFDNHLKSIEGEAIKVFQEDLNGLYQVTDRMLSEINHRGKVAIVWTPNEPIQQRRRKDLDRLLQHYNLINLIDVHCELSENSHQHAAEAIRQYLEQHPDTKAIWCVFDEYAKGVVETLIELGRADINVYSLDLCPEDQELMLREGSPWRATAAVDPFESGRILVRLAMRQVLDSTPSSEHYYSLPLELVTQEDLRALGAKPWQWSHTDSIGWNSDLRSISAHTRAQAPSLYMVSDIVDFADPDLQIIENLAQRIAEVTLETTSDKFTLDLGELDVMSKLLQTDASEEQREKVYKDLVAEINKRTENQRLLLCFDTTERAEEIFLDRGLIDNVLCQLKNTMIIFAGRPKGIMLEKLAARIQEKKFHDAQIVHIDLPPFEPKYSLQYLIEKQHSISIRLSKDLEVTLAILARGKPLILDLAVEYVFRNIELDPPLPGRAELESMSEKDLKEQAELFEKGLVRHIRRLRNRMDRMVLRLSLVSPLSVAGVEALFRISSEEARNLFEEARTYSFIREVTRYGEIEIELHDEMKRLVNEYLWKEFDPYREERRREHQRAFEWYVLQDSKLNEQRKAYKIQIAALEREIAQLDAQPVPDDSHRDKVRAEILRMTIQDKTIRNRRQSITEAWVYHSFEASDPQASDPQAFERWEDLIDRVRNGKHYDFTLRLCAGIETYKQQFTDDQLYEYRFRYARALLDTGDPEESRAEFETLLDKLARSDEHRLAIYNMLGVIYLRLDSPAKARKYQEQCLALISEEDEGSRAFVLNQIGYCYRLQMDEKPSYQKQAQTRYEDVRNLATKAYAKATKEDQKRRYMRLIASANNNLGYLYSLRRDYDRAETLINQAITIWRDDIGEKAESARGVITLGILARDRGYYDLSRRYLEQAITSLPETDRNDMHHEAYFQLGWTEWFDAVDRSGEVNIQGLERAVKLFRHSLKLAQENGFQRSEPGIYHQLASALWAWGRAINHQAHCDEARRLNKLAIDLSEKLKDYRYYVDSVVGEAEFDLDDDDDSHITEYASRLAAYEKKRMIFPLYYGRMRRIQADFDLRKKQYQQAFELYAEAMPLINEHGGYGPYAVEKELRQLAQKLRQLSPSEAIHYLDKYMLAKWKDQKYKGHQLHRYDLVFWCENEIQQTKLRI